MSHIKRKLKQMKRIHELAMINENSAAKNLSLIDNKMQQENAQLTMLTNYQKQYANELENLTLIETKPGWFIQGYHLFTKQLDYSINQQEKKINELELEYNIAKSLWINAHKKSLSTEKLIELNQSALSKENDKKEQRVSDDFYMSCRFSSNNS